MATELALKREIPSMARDEAVTRDLFDRQATIPTAHKLYNGDSRKMSGVKDGSVELVVTSPPYWILKKYRDSDGQLGAIEDYEKFLDNLEQVISEVYRVLIPGGRFICVVGDVCIPRR